MVHTTRRRWAPIALLAAAAALGLETADANAEKSPLRQCTDTAWANYNDCLMETDSSIFRRGCDFDFMFSYERCYIKFGMETFGY